MTAAGTRVEPARRRAGRTVGLGAGLVWVLLPLVPLVLWALSDRWAFPTLLPTEWGLRGWREALDQGAVGAGARSLLIGLVVAALATPAGAMAGRVLAFHRVRFSGLAEAILLVPITVPPFAVVMGLNVLALRLGVPPQVALVVVLAVAAMPYTTYVMRAAYSGYDRGYEDEARTLGAGPRDVLLMVHLPLTAPALAAAAFLAFLVGWSDYIVTLIVGGGGLVTLPMVVGALASASANDAVVAAAAAAAVLPPLMLLALIALLPHRGRVG